MKNTLFNLKSGKTWYDPIVISDSDDDEPIKVNLTKISRKKSCHVRRDKVVPQKVLSGLKQSTLKFNQDKRGTHVTKNSNVSENIKNKAISDGNLKIDLTLDITQNLRRAKGSRICKPRRTKLQKFTSSNQTLFDLWGDLRRSERGMNKDAKEKKKKDVILSIENRKEEGLRIINTVHKGRGVESTITFEKDSFIVEYAGDLMSMKEAKEQETVYEEDSDIGSYMFYFKYKNTKYCVDATSENDRLGRLLNHSKTNPNCYLKIVPLDKIPHLAIFAKRDIDIGEELFIDYGERDKSTIDENPWLKY